MPALLVHTPRYRAFNFGPEHPMRTLRLHLAATLMEAEGLTTGEGVAVREPQEPPPADILRAHRPEYLAALRVCDGGHEPPGARAFGLGMPDNPVFPGVFRWANLACGGTLAAVRAVAEGEFPRAFHPGGGHHHARPARAAGFCYLNDINVALAEQVEKGRRVLYLDLDAHHADGVEEFFAADDRVLVVSFHEWGETLFPGTGWVEEAGRGKGEGFTVNIPLLPGSGDPVYREAFEAVVVPMHRSFAPDLVVLQTGVDAMARDPLAHLALSTEGFCWMLSSLLDLNPRLATLGGGGYEMDTVARCWTLAWSLLAGRRLPDPLPQAYLAERARWGSTGVGLRSLRDPVPSWPDQTKAREHLHTVLSHLRQKGLLPG